MNVCWVVPEQGLPFHGKDPPPPLLQIACLFFASVLSNTMPLEPIPKGYPGREFDAIPGCQYPEFEAPTLEQAKDACHNMFKDGICCSADCPDGHHPGLIMNTDPRLEWKCWQVDVQYQLWLLKHFDRLPEHSSVIEMARNALYETVTKGVDHFVDFCFPLPPSCHSSADFSAIKWTAPGSSGGACCKNLMSGGCEEADCPNNHHPTVVFYKIFKSSDLRTKPAKEAAVWNNYRKLWESSELYKRWVLHYASGIEPAHGDYLFLIKAVRGKLVEQFDSALRTPVYQALGKQRRDILVYLERKRVMDEADAVSNQWMVMCGEMGQHFAALMDKRQCTADVRKLLVNETNKTAAGVKVGNLLKQKCYDQPKKMIKPPPVPPPTKATKGGKNKPKAAPTAPTVTAPAADAAEAFKEIPYEEAKAALGFLCAGLEHPDLLSDFFAKLTGWREHTDLTSRRYMKDRVQKCVEPFLDCLEHIADFAAGLQDLVDCGKEFKAKLDAFETLFNCFNTQQEFLSNMRAAVESTGAGEVRDALQSFLDTTGKQSFLSCLLVLTLTYRFFCEGCFHAS